MREMRSEEFRYIEKPVINKEVDSAWQRKWMAEFDEIRKKLLGSGYNLDIPITSKEGNKVSN